MLGRLDRPRAERPASQALQFVWIGDLTGGASHHDAPATVVEGLARVDFKRDRVTAAEGTELRTLGGAKEDRLALCQVVDRQDVELAVGQESNATHVGFER